MVTSLITLITKLEKLLHACEEELTWLDMKINVKKSSCLRIGPRNHVNCAEVLTSSGQSVPWVSVNEISWHIHCAPT